MTYHSPRVNDDSPLLATVTMVTVVSTCTGVLLVVGSTVLVAMVAVAMTTRRRVTAVDNLYSSVVGALQYWVAPVGDVIAESTVDANRCTVANSNRYHGGEQVGRHVVGRGLVLAAQRVI